jgi:Undecaprenyl-phosphate galactose phosphotransferase WbaP
MADEGDLMGTAIALQSAVTAEPRRTSWTGVAVFGADLLAVTATLVTAVLIRQACHGEFELEVYWRLWPLLGLFPLTYALFGLYPGVAISPVSELRSSTYATTLVFLILSGLTFVLRNPIRYSRLAFFGSWVAALAVVPLVRAGVRAWCSRRPWWGYQAVVLGGAGDGEAVVRKLVDNPAIGIRPVAIFDNDLVPGTLVHGVPVVGPLERAPRFAGHFGISRAILAMPGVSMAELMALLDAHAQTFSRVFVIPGLNGLSSIGVQARDVSRVFALEMRKSLLMRGPRIAKRSLDLVLSLALLVLLAPLLALIAVLVRLDSRGPALYRQNRVGQGESCFRVWKFRSMCRNADEVLRGYLERHPELAEEWRREQKLKRDPRITRIGRILRKTSLDELPQLLNVVRGEMSLVGPRPIVSNEIERYSGSFALYRQVVPGLTGLWQVSGRNQTTYQERVELDDYYVRNWSPWLDLYLLARTVRVVVTGHGAY